MTRKIIFRGIKFGDIYGKDIVYGELVHNNGHAYIKAVDGEQYRVYENSVVQLIAVDKNGAEVYEGDAMTTRDGVTIYAAILYHAKIAPAKDFDFSEEAKRDGWTLKTE